MKKETKRIEAYDIATFALLVQESVLEGYKLNLEDNDKYPVQIGVGFYCTLEKSYSLEKIDTLNNSEEDKEPDQPKQRTRQVKK